MNDPWFGPKRYGYGLSPINWKGWLATVVFIAIAVTFAVFTIVHRLPPLAMVAALTLFCLAFTVLALLKSDAKPWRWRWGDD
jgi:hypothetical protein